MIDKAMQGIKKKKRNVSLKRKYIAKRYRKENLYNKKLDFSIKKTPKISINFLLLFIIYKL